MEMARKIWYTTMGKKILVSRQSQQTLIAERSLILQVKDPGLHTTNSHRRTLSKSPVIWALAPHSSMSMATDMQIWSIHTLTVVPQLTKFI
jgi:hypothetical protein